MKKIYLVLTILGFILNMTMMMPETLRGNILLWTDSEFTTSQAFATEISSIFMYDLFYVVLVYFIWAYFEAKKENMKKWWLTIIWTFVFGLAVGFPLFLYQLATHKEKSKSLS
ncbi:DUF2834 domain-containing protein [Candidatus Kapabacteria bacterium]|nr:DUF2834 domain-containing protein [Candidatus Kapabacteria bacterium]